MENTSSDPIGALVELNGLRHRVWRYAGAGQPVLALHSMGEHGGRWGWLAEALAGRHRLIAPDLRGHGETAAAETYRPSDFVADLVALIEHFDLTAPLPVVGYSMGGFAGLALAAERPDLVSRVAALEVTFGSLGNPGLSRFLPQQQDIARWASLDDSAFRAAALEKYPDLGGRGVDRLLALARTSWPHSAAEISRELLGLDFATGTPDSWFGQENTFPKMQSILARVTCPVLVVRGDQTGGDLPTVLPADHAARAVVTLPNAREIVIAGTGHRINRPPASDVIAAAVAEFFSEASA